MRADSSRLRVDQLLGHELLGLGEAQALLDGALHPHQPDTELVFRHLTDTADTAIAEMIDVVDHAVAILDVDEDLEHVDDVLLGEHPRAPDLVPSDTPIELHASDR